MVLPEFEGVEALSEPLVSWVCKVGAEVRVALPLRTACFLLLRGTPPRKNRSLQCLQTLKITFCNGLSLCNCCLASSLNFSILINVPVDQGKVGILC